ncbi:MAG: efflux RND transporter periplasmic adaptor subunit [bacterium]
MRCPNLVSVGFALMLVFLVQCASSPEEVAAPDATAEIAAAHAGHGGAATQAEVWTCAMHPQIRLPKPGRCPICGMELIPVATAGALAAVDEGLQSPRLAMSAAAVALAEIQTLPVVRKAVAKEIRLVGKVDYDESAVRTISAWVGGRLDRLFVDYTGVRVEQGDHLVRLYSPDLLNAQEELLSARSRIDATRGEASTFLPGSNRLVVITTQTDGTGSGGQHLVASGEIHIVA